MISILFIWLLLFCIDCSSKSHVQAALNLRPIIGVVAETSSSPSRHGDTYIQASYVKWLQSAGALVVPVRINEPDSYYEDIFRNINGVLFPGGDNDIVSSYYAKAANKLYTLAIKANDQGDYFPLWGTCLGFQLLTALTAGKNLLAARPYIGMLPLDLSSHYIHTRLFGNLPKDVRDSLKKENVTANHHAFGLTKTNYTASSKLKNFYRILSTNLDNKGQEFISTMEADSYPFYGTQWHPEKNVYDWNVKDEINHGSSAVRVTQYFADFFVEECRKSGHKFVDEKHEIEALINNYPSVFSHNDRFSETYYFNFTKT